MAQEKLYRDLKPIYENAAIAAVEKPVTEADPEIIYKSS
jgi:hypothetical protein